MTLPALTQLQPLSDYIFLNQKILKMEHYRVLVTDLTDYGNQHCVAGWDLDRKCMIRPEPAPGAFWEKDICGTGNPFAPGNVVTFDADIPNPKTQFPHLNEDRVVQGQISLSESLAIEKFKEALLAMNPVNRDQAFLTPVKVENGKAYIPVGTNCASLKGLLIRSNQLKFTSDKFGDGPAKPRCIITRSNENSINLSIAASKLRESFREGGIKHLINAFDGKEELIVRLGCARGFGSYPNRCYMQINGIF